MAFERGAVEGFMPLGFVQVGDRLRVRGPLAKDWERLPLVAKSEYYYYLSAERDCRSNAI